MRSIKIRRATWVSISMIVVFMLAYGLSSSLRNFLADALAVLQKTDPRDLESGIRDLRLYLLGFGIWAPLVSGSLMVIQMIAAPIPGQLVTFTNGLLFGAFWGTVLSWSSAMVGAALCFGIGKAFGRPVVEVLIGKKSMDYVDSFFDRYGIKAILVARLIPLVPFDPISYGAGMTGMRFGSFFIATGIGQLPATVLYSWLGYTATGAIKTVFLVFVSVLALAVLISILKPWFDRRVMTRAEQH